MPSPPAFLTLGNASLVPVTQELIQGIRARAIEQGVQAHIGSDARRKILPVGLPKRSDQCVPALSADFSVKVAAAVIEPGVAMLTHFNSFLFWG
jgi:hypothetical protein